MHGKGRREEERERAGAAEHKIHLAKLNRVQQFTLNPFVGDPPSVSLSVCLYFNSLSRILPYLSRVPYPAPFQLFVLCTLLLPRSLRLLKPHVLLQFLFNRKRDGEIKEFILIYVIVIISATMPFYRAVGIGTNIKIVIRIITLISMSYETLR